MFMSSEDTALAFFESLISHEGINEFRNVFIRGVEEAFISTFRCEEDVDVVYVNDWDENNNPVNIKNSFKDFLKTHLIKETKRSKEFIKSRAPKALSQPNFNSIFFNYIENTLIDLNKKSNTLDYLDINTAIVDIMTFYHAEYSKYHIFCEEYLDTLSVYRKTTKKEKNTLSFKWKDENQHKEIEYLYNSLIKSNPPFISSSLETFIKAFTNKKLEEDETIKWLCKSVKNKKTISKYSLVLLLQALYDKGFIVSDLNDFNKTTENVFSSPNAVKLRNIKNTKKEKSKTPSRIQEIQAILDGLYIIA